jgi:uncharacterized protein (TIGR02271 family)
MSQTVIGIFEHSVQAHDAKAHLLANGFSSDNVDITKGTPSTGSTSNSSHEEGIGDRISHFFKNLFSDENEAASHTSAARRGTIVTVHAQTSEEASRAADILNEYGAVDVDDYNRGGNDYTSTSNVMDDSTDYSSSTRTTGTGLSSDRLTDNDATDKINVIKEDLQVGKREVETGGVRLRSRIVERPVEESIRLREEHVNIERNTVDRPATDADFAAFKEGTVEVTEYAEKPVVSKTARVVEEVSLGKDVSEREETISDTVRHTEVETENITGSERSYDDDTAIRNEDDIVRNSGTDADRRTSGTGRTYDDNL